MGIPNHFLLCTFTLLYRFQPDKGFSGTDQAPVRDGPVQFDKDTEEDPFGLNKFLTEAKKAKRPVVDRWVCECSKADVPVCIHIRTCAVYTVSCELIKNWNFYICLLHMVQATFAI